MASQRTSTLSLDEGARAIGPRSARAKRTELKAARVGLEHEGHH